MPTGIGGEKLWLCPSLDDSADDLSGNGNHGTYNGGMGTVADTSNGGTRAYSFDGSDDYINCGNSIDTSTPLSVSCWFNSDQFRNFQGLVSRSSASSFPNFILYTHGSSEVGTYINAHRRTSSLVATGNWYHTCFTLDASGNLNLYLDGVLVKSDTSVSMGYSQSFDLLIGEFQAATGSDYPHDGLMDDIRIFDRALTTTEITHLATSRGIEGSPYTYSGLGDEKLWLCPSLDDSADDISGNGNHGTYNGGMGTVADVSNGGTRAYFFDATDDYISSFPTAITSFVGDPAGTSVSCWIKKAATGTDPIFIATLGGSSNGWYGQVLVTLSGAKKELLIKSLGVLDYIDSQDADDTDWHHYAISFDASRNATFYYDGASKGTAAVASPGTSGIALQIGGRAGAIDLVSMYVDDYRIFDGELTLSEAQALASKRGYEVPAAGDIPHVLSSPFHPLG